MPAEISEADMNAVENMGSVSNTETRKPKPILFLDVDGVLNACPPLPGHDVVQKEGFPICIPQGTTERLAKLLEVCEPVWATTWRNKAHPNFGPDLNLGERAWPHIGGDYGSLEHRECGAAWKLSAILEYAGDRRWVFIDDDGRWELQHLCPGKEIPTAGGSSEYENGLVIWPDTAQGLTDWHVDLALTFLEANHA